MLVATSHGLISEPRFSTPSPIQRHIHTNKPVSIPRRLTRTKSGSWRNIISQRPTPAPSDSGSSALSPLPEDRDSPDPEDFTFPFWDDAAPQDDYVGDIFDEDLHPTINGQPIQEKTSFGPTILTPPSSIRRQTRSPIEDQNGSEHGAGNVELQARLSELESANRKVAPAFRLHLPI